MAARPIDPSKVGQDRQYKSPEEQEAANNGVYRDPLEGMSIESLLPLKEFPKAPDPKPYR